MILAHDYLIQMGGAERVVAVLHQNFPDAPIITSAVDYKRLLPAFRNANIKKSWMQHLPLINTHYKKYFFLYPAAFRSFKPLDTDITLVSSSGFSKWLRFTKNTKVICYCHTPPRFFWQTDEYLKNEIQNSLLKKFVKKTIPFFRNSDYQCAQRVDYFIANSETIRERIRNFYNRESVVIHPPVNINRFTPQKENDGYYLIVSRLVAYKSVDKAILAFNENKKRLIIAGEGPDRKRLESIANPNIEFKGRLSDAEVEHYMKNCYALVFPGFEDFGMVPVEANACGKPVLAYGFGGALETIKDGLSGMFFYQSDPATINSTLEQFEKTNWNADAIRKHSENFDEPHFIQKLSQFIEEVKNGKPRL